MNQQDHETLKQIIREEIALAIEPINKKLDPMYMIFVNAKGFGNVAVWMLKAMVLVGAGLGVLYAFIKWLKQ